MIRRSTSPGTRAVTELDSGDFEQTLADRFFHERFAHPRDPIDPALDRGFLRNNFTENRQDRTLEHRLQLARRTGQEKQMRRFLRRSCVRRQDTSPGADPFSFGKTVAPCGTSAWRDSSIRQSESTARRSRGDRGHDRRIVLQFQSQEFSRDLPRDIVGRRPKTTGHENDVGLLRRFGQRRANRRAVRHSELPLDAQPEREDLPRDEGEVRIEHVAEQKLGAGVDDDDASSLKR